MNTKCYFCIHVFFIKDIIVECNCKIVTGSFWMCFVSSNCMYLNFYAILWIMPSFEEVGVYCFAFVSRPIDRSIRPSVIPYTNLVRSITRELIAQGSSNFVWWLVMTGRWPQLNLGFLGQMSSSQWHTIAWDVSFLSTTTRLFVVADISVFQSLSLVGHTCFTNIFCLN